MIRVLARAENCFLLLSCHEDTCFQSLGHSHLDPGTSRYCPLEAVVIGPAVEALYEPLFQKFSHRYPDPRWIAITQMIVWNTDFHGGQGKAYDERTDTTGWTSSDCRCVANKKCLFD